MSRQNFALRYQKCPILLVQGSGSAVPGTTIPITNITQANRYPKGVTQQASGLSLDNYLFDFYPLSGASLIDNQVATYPFLNQTIAANAIITQPLRVSLIMLAPVNQAQGYAQKDSVFNSLKNALDLHISQGGTFTVLTPSYIYLNCLLTGLHDISAGDPKRPQDRWQWDFIQPLITAQQAQQVMSSAMSKLGNGLQYQANAKGSLLWSGLAPAVGSQQGGVAASAVPSSRQINLTSSPSQPTNNLGNFQL